MMKAKYFPFIFFFLLFSYLSLHAYLYRWLVWHFSMSSSVRAAARVAALLLCLSFPLSMFIHRKFPGDASGLFYLLAASWLGILLIWSTSAFCTDILEKAAGAVSLRVGRKEAGFFGLYIAGFMCAYGFWGYFKTPAVTELHINLKNLPVEMDGFRLVQISDIHLGNRFETDRFSRIMEKAAGLKPDIVVFTGDIIDPGFECTDELKRSTGLLSARQGIFGVLGNHEFYAGLDRTLACYSRCGIRVLRNETVDAGGLQLAGVDDILAAGLGDAQIEAVLKKLEPKAPAVYLSHQPLKFSSASGKGVGLMLSGHTHAGQIFPFNLFVRAFYPRYFKGLYRDKDSFLYVTSGAGSWGPPMRLFAPAEIPLFVLHTAD
ncbi:MAG: metallophosphoesterase [bacterium]